MTVIVTPRREQCCANCDAGFVEEECVRCRLNPPAVIATPEDKGKFRFHSVFPPMHPTKGWCKQWSPKIFEA